MLAMDKMGMAYVLRVDDHHAFANSIAQLREMIQFWRRERPDVSVAFVTSVAFECANVPECARIFAEWT